MESRLLLAGSGLNGEYFANRDLTGLAFERVDPQVDFDWGGGSPGAPIGSNYFSVRWTGFVVPRYSEVYSFYTVTDDGVRLWVDGELLVDQWVNQSATEHTGTIYLDAGRQYAIKMEYYENAYDAVARLLWSSTNQAKEVIPSNRLTTLPVPRLEVDTRPMVQGELNVDGPGCRSIGTVGFEASTNPPGTLYAIQVGTLADAGWLHLDDRGGRIDVYADGTQPEWHTAAEWAGQRLRGLQADRAYALYAMAGDGQGAESGSMPVATFTTNIDCDVDADGDVALDDYSYVEAAVLAGGELGVELPWACDVNDDGAVDNGDLTAVEWRIDHPVPSEAAIELYVAPDGSDGNPGTFGEPLGTLEGARAAIRAIKTDGLPRGGIVVWLRGGVYERSVPLALTDADAGAPDRPIVWRAFPNETVRIVGGQRLDPAWFEPVTDASPVWDRIDPAAQGQLLQVDLSAHGITDYGGLANRGFKLEAPAALELFFNGEPMQLGRWPNYGFETTVSAPTSAQFTYSGTRPERWTDAEDVWVHGYWSYHYADVHNHVVSIDTATQTITIEGYRHYGVRADQPWYAYNLLEEVDRPGEWYLDRGTGVLYFLPPGDVAAGEAWVSTLDSDLVRLNGAAHVSLEGVHLELSRRRLVSIEAGDHNTLVECRLIGAGTDAAVIDGSDSGLEGCEIAWPGRGGVILSGGDRYTLTPSGNFIRNCDIHDFSRFDFTYNPGVRLNGCGHVVAHNAIHDTSHAAVMDGGNEHRIEYNDIYNVCRLAGDAGAIYSGGDWASQGNVLRYNFIHHVTSDFGGDVHGIYLDDCDSGDTVFGNVLYRIAGIALENGGGRDNSFENNVVAWADRGHNADRRGTAWINDTPGSSMNQLERINEFHYQDPPWSVAYPRLAAIPNDYALLEPYKNPGGSTCSRNLFWQADPWLAENSSWGAGAFDYYAAVEDNIDGQYPWFVDEAALNLALRPESPAWSIPGFETIPFDQIGIEPYEPRFSPAEGAPAGLRPALSWSEVPGALVYDVYLGRDEEEVRSADHASAAFQGTTAGTQFTPGGELYDVQAHFWRVDAVTPAGTLAGQVHHFVAGDWSQRTLGEAGLIGDGTFQDGAVTVTGGGSDIHYQQDHGHYVYRTLDGDGTIAAQVTDIVRTDPWAKAGVMIRESLDPGSRRAAVLLTPDNGVQFNRRTAADANATSTTISGPSAPHWLALSRHGDTFSAYHSADGSTWSLIGVDTIAMPASVTIGLAVTSHDDGTLTTARFENVAVTGPAPTGLYADYFPNDDLTGAALRRTDPRLDFDWGLAAPHPSMNPDSFSVRWTGYVQPRYSETYTLHTITDGAVRLWVNGQLIIDQWTDHPTMEHTGTIALEAGKQYAVRMEYRDGGGAARAELLWSSSTQPREVVPTERLAKVLCPGIDGQYFDDPALTELKLIRTDAAVAFDWALGSPDPSIEADGFSVRWTGFATPQFSETYTFRTFTDDGVRLWVDDQLLVDAWIDQSATEHTAAMALEAGRAYAIRMEYYENSLDAVAKLLWSSPSQPAEIVPVSPAGALDVDANGSADALTDGILVLRYLFGFTGDALVEDALAPDAGRTEPGQIAARLDAGRHTMLDVDSNGTPDALTDGILILRYLFGFAGSALVQDALAPDATRTDPGKIMAFLDLLKPPVLDGSPMSFAPLAAAGGEGATASLPKPPADAEGVDPFWTAPYQDRHRDDWARRVSLYHAMAFDLVRGRGKPERQDSTAPDEMRLLMLARD